MVDTAQLDVLECILCHAKFNEQSVRGLDYFATTGICFNCYLNGQKSPYVIWCFGKKDIRTLSNQLVEFGYDPEAKACSLECPDKKICQLFVTNEIFIWRAEMGKKVKVEDAPVGEIHTPKKVKGYKGPVLPFRQMNAMTTRAFLLCMKGILIDDLVKWVKAQGGEPRRILRLMRSGTCHGKNWRVHEKDGFLKIMYEG